MELSSENTIPLNEPSDTAQFDWCSYIEEGGVTSPMGFKASGIHAGLRKNPGRKDMALVVSDSLSACAATFTQNVFCAAPVMVSRDSLEGDSWGEARALVVNSGTANAATGPVGMENARATQELVAEEIGCLPNEVMVASTGVIGMQLPMETMASGIKLAAKEITDNANLATAEAIMTTDTVPKHGAVVFTGEDIGFEGCAFTIGAMAKGSGMIMPNMATMIACITTDAPVKPQVLRQVLLRVVNKTFNRVTVDSDTSTNDCCFIFANGQALSCGNDQATSLWFEPETEALERFEKALFVLCRNLARTMAADGEGATRLITVHVSGAASDEDADLAARAVANSPLVKTAVFGHDCNWGRIAMAIGKSGAKFAQEQASIDIMGLPVCRGGLPIAFDEEEALRRFERPEIVITIDLGAGNSTATMFSCDFSHDYVTINGDYRT